MKTEQPILITSIDAKESFPKYRFISFNGYLSAEGTKPLGVAQVDADANDLVPIIVQGIAIVVSSDYIAAGSKVKVMDDGYAADYDGGEVAGYALDTSTGPSQLIRILLP